MVEGSCTFVPEDRLYDFIVVGCGAVGCPLARTLADAGNRVLVLERGKERAKEKTPHAMDIFGAGKAVADETLSQLIQTNQGVRSQAAAVMGGGTSINMAIVAMENKEYFEYLNSTHGWKLNSDMLKEAQKWVGQAFKPMPQDQAYGSRLALSLQDEGYRPVLHSHEKAIKFGGPQNGLGSPAEIMPGHVWGGLTVFDKDKQFFRNAADVFLYMAGGQFAHPDRLLVKTEQYVERVLFANPRATVPQAICVTHRHTTAEDIAPIGLDVPPPRPSAATGGILPYLLSYARQIINWIWPSDTSTEISCIRRHGEVILSAGAVHSPLLLFRSGVGPREQLREMGVEEVVALEQLGQNLSDRVLIPIQMFLKEKKRKEDRVPRVCQVFGLRHHGPQCEGVGVNERTLKCSLLTTEELSGPNIIHGLLWASHLLVPPSWRDHPAAHAVFKFVRFCEGKVQFRSTREYPPACVFVEGLLDCLDRSFSIFYFTTEPKSRGYIRQHRDGRIEVEANYLKDEQDLFDAVRGVQSLINQVNGGHLNDIVEPLQPGSCPVMMLHTVVKLFLQFAQADDLPQYEKQLLSVRRHAGDLQPLRRSESYPQTPAASGQKSEMQPLIDLVNGKGERRGSPISTTPSDAPKSQAPIETRQQRTAAQPVEALEEAMREIFEDREKLKQLLENGPAQKRRRQTAKSPSPTAPGANAETAKPNESVAQSRGCFGDAERACKDGPIHSDLYSTTCSAHDIFTKRYGSACEPLHGVPTAQSEYSEGFASWEESLLDAGIQEFFRETMPTGSSQRAATFPPILPRVDDPEALAAFAVTYMTSIWHFAGTAAVGHVVDHDFQVKGIRGLSIADASILNQMTRLNPTATLLTLGRYIGMQKAKSHEMRKKRKSRKATAELPQQTSDKRETTISSVPQTS
ncbi:GMC oxidoreductase [Besnoitia besnoiti]|uniref:GMC oxidoreductase n=1 Tax=Besnoitia besnoiti TaxID=94643 RepID=A0A2A9MB27_BESBE|nr:GMC oxidoreductase [Besnoitia besnoiti]PFH32827.1 GMC oxidoreductase [Besnoitia besnoiti]